MPAQVSPYLFGLIRKRTYPQTSNVVEWWFFGSVFVIFGSGHTSIWVWLLLITVDIWGWRHGFNKWPVSFDWNPD